jgi:hypothetical protein
VDRSIIEHNLEVNKNIPPVKQKASQDVWRKKASSKSGGPTLTRRKGHSASQISNLAIKCCACKKEK